MVWLEVETKVQVKDVASLRSRIKKIANFKEKQSRGDDYFALNIDKYPKKAFRIRYDGKKYVLNFKKRLKSLFSRDIVVKEEFEFVLSDIGRIDNFLYFLEDLGFKEWVKKRKKVESYEYKKDKRVVIEINFVENLGYYMEIEYLARRSEVGKAKKKIRQVLRELEIGKDQIDNIGYTKRLYEKGIKDKKYFLKTKKGEIID
tara:strand:+ start:167 stop:772 length:606 start_codon:yes stop_codon:yes gene_type:complete